MSKKRTIRLSTLNFGNQKASKLSLVLILLTACTGINPVLEISSTPLETQISQASKAPGRTAFPQDTPTQSLSPFSPSHTPVSTETDILEPPINTYVLPDSSLYTWRSVVTGLDMPVGIANAGDGTQRIFVLEQPGRIRIIQDESLLSTHFLDITDRVGSQGFEQGLLGLAFHPAFSGNGFFYVNYTDLIGDTVIARFQVSRENLDRADPSSELRLLQVDQPYRNHNGGGLAFGPDGYLYIGLGDGGSAGDPQNNAQSLNNLLGKLLRIDVDQGELYGIPADNPFSGRSGLPEIWGYGLRNPWRFSFDHLSGDLYIGDVGQGQWEEIDYLPAGSPGGSNFGWRFYEGLHPYTGSPPSGTEFILPVAEYGHDIGCSVTGGIVYRGMRFPDWMGIYIYGDYCTQRIWGLTRDQQGNWISTILFSGIGAITSFGEDEAGEVYVVNHAGELRVLDSR